MTDPEAAQPVPVRTALIVLAVAYFFVGATSLGVIGLVAEMSAGLGVRESAIAGLVTIFAVCYAVSAPVAQAVLGGIARRRLIAAGVTLMAVSCFICAIAPDYLTAAASRVGMALGAAITGPTASAAGAAMVPPEQRARALAAVFTGLTVASVLGMPLASFLGQTFGWRVAWVIMGLAALATAPVVLRVMDDDNRGSRATLSVLLSVLRDRALALSISTTALQLMGQFITYGLLAVWLVQVAEAPHHLVPLLLFCFGIGGVLGNQVSSVIAGRLGPEGTVTACLVTVILALATLWLLPPVLWLIVPTMMMWSAAGLMVMAPLQTRLVRLDPGKSNLSLALNASAVYVGMSVGSAVSAAAYETVGISVLPLLTAVGIAMALLAFRASLVR
ncbi:MAG: MFS transporter [Pseudomonadota bacterium]